MELTPQQFYDDYVKNINMDEFCTLPVAERALYAFGIQKHDLDRVLTSDKLSEVAGNSWLTAMAELLQDEKIAKNAFDIEDGDEAFDEFKSKTDLLERLEILLTIAEKQK